MTTHPNHNRNRSTRHAMMSLASFLLILTGIHCSYKISVLNNAELRDRFPNGVDNIQIVQGNTNDVKDKTFEILGFDTGEITGCKKYTEGRASWILFINFLTAF